MTEQHEFDVVVIGAGSTGENIAARAVRGGLSAAVVEAELVGGDCSYWACMPSKALLRPGQVLSAARAVAGAREAVTGRLDLVAALARRDGFTSNWDDAGQVRWLEGASIALFRGHGRIAGERRVVLDGPDGPVALTARHAVAVATGSAPVLPPVAGLDDAAPWTTRDATSAKAAPGHLIVLGGGVAGCELSQAWASLGSRVTLVEMADRLLPSYEPVVGQLVGQAMTDQGIDVRTGRSAVSVRRQGGRTGPFRVVLDDETSVEGDELLVAAGRRPRTEDVGLETIGLEPGSWLEVDDTMAVRGVDAGWLYAAGDVNHRVLLTHQGKYQARVCGDVIAARANGEALQDGPWGRHAATADHRAFPQVVFTDPEVAAIGPTEVEARESGLRIRVVDYALGDVAGAALHADGYSGHARFVVDEDRRVLIGATFVGSGVGELVHAATIAVVGEVPLERLWHAVPSYPTISEVWLRFLEQYGL